MSELQHQGLGDDACPLILDDLAERGWSVRDGFLSPPEVVQLAREVEAEWRAGGLHQAGIGRAAGFQVRPEIRSDHVRWLDPGRPSAAQRHYLDRLEELRLALNQGLYLGLFEFEGHLAYYPPGTCYRKHLDQFQGVGLRTVTCVLYLNPGWQEADGGQLRLYHDPGDACRFQDVLPLGGRLVTFLSARYYHEVLPGLRPRLSITGWFKTRP